MSSNKWQARAYSAVRRLVPVRTFKGWDAHHDPGWLEIDLVAHCGSCMDGRFLLTLVSTDIATGWSECLPLLQRDGVVVLMALRLIRRQLPFPLRGIDADNDPVFMNTLMEAWCDRTEDRIKLTRSPAYKSNDQAWVEQKNGVLMRRVLAHRRLEGPQQLERLCQLYGALRLFTNIYQPSAKESHLMRATVGKAGVPAGAMTNHSPWLIGCCVGAGLAAKGGGWHVPTRTYRT